MVGSTAGNCWWLLRNGRGGWCELFVLRVWLGFWVVVAKVRVVGARVPHFCVFWRFPRRPGGVGEWAYSVGAIPSCLQRPPDTYSRRIVKLFRAPAKAIGRAVVLER